MNTLGRIAIILGIVIACFSNAHAQPTFGIETHGSDLEPVSASLSDGGPGSTSASVSFSTFRAEARFDPLSTYLPILRAESTGIDATFDDDRTHAEGQAYQAFTSTVTQTIRLEIALSSIVTNSAGGTSGVLSNIYVIGGPGFSVSNTFCSPGQFTFDGIYLCGTRIAQSTLIPGLNFSNLFNGGSNPLIVDTLTFNVSAGESFGIFADLSAGSFMGTADAFNTLTLGFENDQFIQAIEVPATPVPSIHPIAIFTLVPGLLVGAGLVAMRRRG